MTGVCNDCGVPVTHRNFYCPDCATARRDAATVMRKGPRGRVIYRPNPERERRIPLYRKQIEVTGRIVYLPGGE